MIGAAYLYQRKAGCLTTWLDRVGSLPLDSLRSTQNHVLLPGSWFPLVWVSIAQGYLCLVRRPRMLTSSSQGVCLPYQARERILQKAFTGLEDLEKLDMILVLWIALLSCHLSPLRLLSFAHCHRPSIVTLSTLCLLHILTITRLLNLPTNHLQSSPCRPFVSPGPSHIFYEIASLGVSLRSFETTQPRRLALSTSTPRVNRFYPSSRSSTWDSRVANQFPPSVTVTAAFESRRLLRSNSMARMLFYPLRDDVSLYYAWISKIETNS